MPPRPRRRPPEQPILHPERLFPCSQPKRAAAARQRSIGAPWRSPGSFRRVRYRKPTDCASSSGHERGPLFLLLREQAPVFSIEVIGERVQPRVEERLELV